MTIKKIGIAASIGVFCLGVGCRKNAVDPGAFKSALNNYYSSLPVCVWSSPVKFPAQADTSNESQTKGFDALVDAGMLTRASAEKKRFLIGSKQVNDYDVSDKGRSIWTVDSSEPGYGNFCFGHPEVASIDSFTPPDDGGATQYSVAYHYGVAHPSDWATSAEMKTAFPKIDALTSNQKTATATLTKSDQGWQVSGVAPPADTSNSNPPLPQ